MLAARVYLEDVNKGRVPAGIPFLHPLWHSGLYFINNFCLAAEEPQPFVLFHLPQTDLAKQCKLSGG